MIASTDTIKAIKIRGLTMHRFVVALIFAAGVSCAFAAEPEMNQEATAAATLTPVWWPTKPTFPVWVNGSNAQDVGMIYAVATPSLVTLGVKQRFYLGGNPCTAYNGRGDLVSATAIPHPASKTHFAVFTNSAKYPDHSGFVNIKYQQDPTHQVYLEGIKPGKIIVRCYPAIRIEDAGRKIEVHLHRVFADILVEVIANPAANSDTPSPSSN